MLQLPPLNLFPYFRTLDDLPGRVEWREFFANDNPVEIDVGSNRGVFLVNSGEANPQINYLGIEIDFKEARRAARRLKKRGLENVRVWGGDVRLALDQYVPRESVAAVHVYFPDPWWKKKHRKRRVFTDRFLEQVVHVLKPGGLLHSWTDVADYWEIISALVDHHPRFERLPQPEEHQPAHDMDYHTSFERKKRKAGETIYRGCWQKRAAD